MEVESAVPVESKQSQSPKVDKEDVATKALNCLTQGKRHLLVNDISAAVNSLQESCRLFADHYGDLAPECADANFYYGRALLELARIETGVLGNALEGVPSGEDQNNSQVEDPENMTEKERDEVTDMVDEALEENFDKNQSDGSQKDKQGSMGEESDENDQVNPEKVTTEEVSPVNKENKDLETKNPSDVKENICNGHSVDEPKTNGDKPNDAKVDEVKENGHSDETTDDADNQKKDENGEEESMETDERDADESQDGDENDDGAADETTDVNETTEQEAQDDVDNLQLAWEVLETSKLIYKKQLQSSNNKSIKLKLAQTHLKLGEVGQECENYQIALEDFQECLKIQLEELPADDRSLSETHYQIGIAYSLLDDFDNAVESLEAASRILEQRVSNLQKSLNFKDSTAAEQKDNDDKKPKDSSPPEQIEIEEIQKLLPDIKEKIADMSEMKKEHAEKMKKMKELAFASMMGGNGSSDNTSSENVFSAASAELEKPVSNIGHLIRKKRKPEDEPDKSAEIKRSKEETVEKTEAAPTKNGISSNTNGHSEEASAAGVN